MASTDELLHELMEICRKHEDPTRERGFLSQLFGTTLYHEKQTGVAEKQVSPKEE